MDQWYFCDSTTCPYCKGHLIITDGETYRCMNANCHHFKVDIYQEDFLMDYGFNTLGIQLTQ